jgi:predicted phage terminase large subunit-like protein
MTADTLDRPDLEIKPQPGPQTAILNCPADVGVYGGAAGGGKSWGLLVDPLRFVLPNPDRPRFDPSRFRGLILRSTSTEIRNPGGLWDESQQLYRAMGGIPREQALEWRFPSGASIKFSYLEHEKDKYKYRGAQLAYLGFDELTSFSQSQFWYLISRLRTNCGVRPYCRATCNPDADSFVAWLIDWYLGPDGYPIPERSGVLRYYRRDGDQIRWADTAAELAYIDPKTGRLIEPKSFTFIPAELTDNQILMEADPSYLANLMSLPMVERERLLRGNWKIRHTSGNVFRSEWWKLVGVAPRDFVRGVRYWDKAGASDKSRDGDYTCGTLVLETRTGRFVVADVVHGRWTFGERNQRILQTAQLDAQLYGGRVELWIEQEPGHNALESRDTLAKLLRAYGPRFDRVVKAKLARCMPLSAAAESGIVDVVTASWTRDWMDEMEGFPTAPHDDRPDSAGGAYAKLATIPDRSNRRPPTAGKR